MTERKTKHGHGIGGHSRTYKSWAQMLQRCKNPNTPGWEHYGGRGIRVCDRWSVFANFLADVGVRPDGMTLDRFPNRDGNYEPGNVRWATRTKQARNQTNVKLGPDDVQEILGRIEHGETMASIARRLGVNQSTVGDIKHGRTWIDQLDGPVV